MAINDDDRDEKSEDAQGNIVEIDKCYLGFLTGAAEERIEYEDLGDSVLVFAEDLNRLRWLAYRLSREYASYEDETD